MLSSAVSFSLSPHIIYSDKEFSLAQRKGLAFAFGFWEVISGFLEYCA